MIRDEIVSALKNNILVLSDLIENIPEELFYRKRGKGYWSIHQHISHLSDVQQKVYGRLELFLADKRPVIQPINPDKDTENQEDHRKVDESLNTFAHWRLKQVKLAESSCDEIWRRTIEHPEYDLYTFEITLRHMVLHDGFHMHRIEELWLMKDEFILPL